MHKKPLLVGILAAQLLFSACVTEPVVTTITLNTPSIFLDAFGATFQLTASLEDENGKPIHDQGVTWSLIGEQVVTLSAAGLVTALANGTAAIQAAADGVTASISVSVEQAVGSVQVFAGDRQTGEVGAGLPALIEALVNDARGNPIAEVSVAFTVTAGGGSLVDATVATDTNGRAATVWTLGTVAGATQTATASWARQTAAFGATAVAAEADSLAEVSGGDQSAATSTLLSDSLVVRVVDRFGNAVEGPLVRFTIAGGGGSVSPSSVISDVDGRAATQWTLGAAVGTQTVQATVTGVTNRVPSGFITAEGLFAGIAAKDGDGQTGLVGFGVNIAPSVQVTDAGGLPLAGVSVTFAVVSGGGSVTDAVQITDATGVAGVTKWTLGDVAGANELSATAAGDFTGNPVGFTATGVAASYDIEVRFLTPPTAAQQDAFDRAAVSWQELIFGDVADAPVNIAADECTTDQPALNETIDDLVIFVTLEPIDGPGGILGSAGPCFIRTAGKLPLIGVMRFDTDDLATLEADGALEDVIRHEMGHVLGLGSLWSFFGFLQNPSLPRSPGADTHFNGPKAIEAFDVLGGTSYTGGAKVPVENEQGGAGTRDSHWRESVFDAELMTGFLNSGVPNPLSRLSVASMWDLGYLVNLDGSDAYVQSFSVTSSFAAAAGKLYLKDDIRRGPIFVVDASGRVSGVLRR